jgi:glucokinase
MTLHRSTKRSGRLVGDLGGTHARFALLGSEGCLEHVEVLTCADYPRVEDAIVQYLAGVGVREVAEVCLAVAGPADQDQVDLPNNHWAFSRHRLEEALGAPLVVINDFTAQALSLDMLAAEDLRWMGLPRPVTGHIRGIVGPGTGLGVAVLMPSGEVLPSEGGHVGFAPTSNHQIDLLRALHSRFRRVSVERLASGPGLENLYWANHSIETGDREGAGVRRSAREVAAMAAAGEAMALRSVADFFDVLATFAGDLALMAWAAGGIYLSGGVLRRLMPFLDLERFRARFEDKGRFTRFLETVPLASIQVEHPGLLGCSAALGGRTGALRGAEA